MDLKEGVEHPLNAEVKLTDLEDGIYVPPGSDILGKQAGNQMWRSPEAHASGRLNKPSDIFSFGIVCIYAVLKDIIFAIDEADLEGGAVEPQAIILERQISYFSDPEGLQGLLDHLGDNPWCDILAIIRSGVGIEENPARPFQIRKGVDSVFKDLIKGLTNMDPARRLTAREALAHQWFDDEQS